MLFTDQEFFFLLKSHKYRSELFLPLSSSTKYSRQTVGHFRPTEEKNEVELVIVALYSKT